MTFLPETYGRRGFRKGDTAETDGSMPEDSHDYRSGDALRSSHDDKKAKVSKSQQKSARVSSCQGGFNTNNDTALLLVLSAN